MAHSDKRFEILASNGSPYSMKIRSFMRYKRIPFNWNTGGFGNINRNTQNRGWPEKYAHIKPKVIPVLEFPNGFAMNESTEIIQKIERDVSSTRSVIPKNRCIAFIADVLEDFADEWMTKIMFAMRWNRPIDQKFGAIFITDSVPTKYRMTLASHLAERQVERCALVGCQNDEEMHDSFHEICGIFERYLTSQDDLFLFGAKPTNADFAMYGQMNCWRQDMTPNRLLREHYPFTMSWMERMDDLSGVEINEQFKPNLQMLPKIVKELLTVAGNCYMPFLAANADALRTGKKTFEVQVKVNGKSVMHRQGPFKWQGKCLLTLRQKLNMLRTDSSFGDLKTILIECNCWDVLNGPIKISSKL